MSVLLRWVNSGAAPGVALLGATVVALVWMNCAVVTLAGAERNLPWVT
ncbi:hypothetical protein ACIP5Y_46915 [Nocardia sp. NPDC088792]